MPPVTVTKSGPGMAKLLADLKRIKNSEVLVGIPAEKTLRKGDTINNASLLFILTKGSPLRHIPATPILEPAIEQNKNLITPHLGQAARAILNSDPLKAEKELHQAGTVAVNSVKRYFVEAPWPPNAPSTFAAKTKRERKQFAKGKITAAQLTEAEGMVRRNINTGKLRRAITSVVRTTDQ